MPNLYAIDLQINLNKRPSNSPNIVYIFVKMLKLLEQPLIFCSKLFYEAFFGIIAIFIIFIV